MQSIFSHVAYLLTKHECVILPGFGALVVYDVNAKQLKERGVFISPSQSVGFNPDLKHNDGLLAGLLMKDRKIAYNEANLLVLQFCENFRSRIESQSKAMLPMVGTFTRLDDHRFAFIPEGYLSANASLYGFGNFHLSLLADIVENNSLSHEAEIKVYKGKKDILWIPVNKSVLKTIGATAAVVAAMLLFTTPIDSRQEVPSQYASVINSFDITKEDQAEEVDVQDESSRLTIAPAADSDSLSLVLSTSGQPDQYYYVVVGSYATQKQVSQVLPEVRSAFENAAALKGSQWHWIYVDKFEDKHDAEQFLSIVHAEHPNHKDAWILTRPTRM